MKIPRISVIIITRNRPQTLGDCLDHLAQQSYTDFETIVVDSSDNYVSRQVAEQTPNVQYYAIWDGRNNMPQARNLGLARARGDIVVFIDDDSMVFPNWLENIVAGYFEEQIGGVGGRTIDERLKIDVNDDRIGKVLLDGTAVHNFIREFPNPIFVEWFVGCNMSFKGSVLKALGGFDETYGGDNSYEEIDIATRVRKAGYKLLWTPYALVEHIRVHRVSGVVSRDYDNPQLRYHQAHNRVYYVLKNIGVNKVFILYLLKTLYGLGVYSIRKPGIATWKFLCATSLGFLVGSWNAFFRWIRDGK